MKVFLALTCAVLIVSVSAVGRRQTYKVKVKFTCDGKPVTNTKVTLYDDDTMGFDDKMDEGVTNRNGEVLLSGEDSEVGRIDPMIKIKHKCGSRLFRKTWKKKLPKSYINKNKPYPLGTIELTLKD